MCAPEHLATLRDGALVVFAEDFESVMTRSCRVEISDQ